MTTPLPTPSPAPSPAPLPHDPDLEPVPAAKAALAAEAERRIQATAAIPAPAVSSGPVISRAEPDRWTRVVDLSFGLLVDGVEVKSLTLTRLSARALMDMMMADDSESSVNRRARAAIAGVHPDVLDALEADDAVEVAEAIRPFLPRALLGAERLEADVLTAAAGLAAVQD